MSEFVNIQNDEVTIPYFAIHKDGQISGFFGQFRFLSNFFILDEGVGLGELIFPSVEHAYQAAKWPVHLRSQFVEITSGQAKKLGKAAPQLNVKTWNKNKVELMRNLVYQKFEKNIKLRKMLMETDGYTLDERNNWGDVFWGMNEKGEGENQLGKILMVVREKFIAASKNEEW
jgi:ribA/ribD-fused uncharacterized protein